MANVLRPEKQEQVRALGRLGWSLRRIQRETGVDRASVQRYLTEAGIPVREPRQRRPPSRLDSKPASQVFPDSDPVAPSDGAGATEVLTSAAKSACEPHRAAIEAAFDLGRNGKSIWQDLVDVHGFTGHYESVKRFIRRLRPQSLIGHPRIETAAGDEGQVDYGEGPLVRHPETGKYRRPRLFILTLGCSRKSVSLLCWKSSSRTWSELHEESFRRLGGATRTIVLDNLKEGVIAADVYEPTLNPLYREVLAHYGVVAMPARPGHPDRKGKVESAIGYVQKTALKGRRFESLEEAQRHLDQWTERWADTRIHGTTKRQVAAMFAEEQPLLLPLPAQPFRYFEYGVRVVHLDSTVEVARGYYGVPPRWIGQQVHVRWDQLFVRILDPKTGGLLREHVRQKPGHFRVDARDRSPKTPPGVLQLLDQARRHGKHIGRVCELIEQRREQYAARQIIGVLSLVKKRGFGLVDDCCRIALDSGFASYRLVRNLVDRAPSHGPQLRQVDGLIRELSIYRDFIDQKTKEPHEPDRTRSLPPQTPPVGHGEHAADAHRASPG